MYLTTYLFTDGSHKMQLLMINEKIGYQQENMNFLL